MTTSFQIKVPLSSVGDVDIVWTKGSLNIRIEGGLSGGYITVKDKKTM